MVKGCKGVKEEPVGHAAKFGSSLSRRIHAAEKSRTKCEREGEQGECERESEVREQVMGGEGF